MRDQLLRRRTKHKGEYAGALNVWDIQKWMEEHPDVKLEGARTPLEGLADDANPVVVIVEH